MRVSPAFAGRAPPRSGQIFVLAVVPTEAISPTDVAFACGGATAAITAGLSTLLVSAASPPGPDIIPVVATVFGDDILNILVQESRRVRRRRRQAARTASLRVPVA
jgi:hypothetical protein